MKHSLSIRDNAFGHSPISNSPTIPLGVESPIEWDRDERMNLNPAGMGEIFTDDRIPSAPDGSTAWLIEPSRPEVWAYVRHASDRFSNIWTADKGMLGHLYNALFLTNAGCWIRPEDRKVWPKSKGISTIASNKRGGEGYDMRHEAIRRFPRIDSFGPEYTPLPGVHQQDKIAALRDYRFHLCIENTRRDYFFSEKLIDCFMTGTVPIYWGCPSIGKFFNQEGMFCVSSLDEVGILLKAMIPETYDFQLPAIRDNFERAKAYCLTEDFIVRNLLK